MHREHLLRVMQAHELACSHIPGCGFSIITVWELADGVLLAHDNDREFNVYFAKPPWVCRDPEMDSSSEILHAFPANCGLMVLVGASSVEQALTACQYFLSGGHWHQAPLLIAGVDWEILGGRPTTEDSGSYKRTGSASGVFVNWLLNVGVARFELTTSRTPCVRATNCAIPRWLLL